MQGPSERGAFAWPLVYVGGGSWSMRADLGNKGWRLQVDWMDEMDKGGNLEGGAGAFGKQGIDT